jgi:hypothetical protein
MVKTLAVLPQPVAEAQEYLASEGVHVDEIRQAELSSIGVRATPTWMIVDKAGMVTNIWEGKLPPSEEDEVLRTVDKGYSTQSLMGTHPFGVSY